MRLLYLGEIIQDSYVTWCLRQSQKFERIDHFTKSTLNFTHVHMNPLPDSIIIKCDWEDHELGWSKRYALDIPKVFVVCDSCLRKINQYMELGEIFNIDYAMKSNDLMLETLVKRLERFNHNV